MAHFGEAVLGGDFARPAFNSGAVYLDEPDMPDVDLFVRSSGEQRTSNFLIWQSAYAEMVFLDTLWPDFDRADAGDTRPQLNMKTIITIILVWNLNGGPNSRQIGCRLHHFT